MKLFNIIIGILLLPVTIVCGILLGIVICFVSFYDALFEMECEE